MNFSTRKCGVYEHTCVISFVVSCVHVIKCTDNDIESIYKQFTT